MLVLFVFCFLKNLNSLFVEVVFSYNLMLSGVARNWLIINSYWSMTHIKQFKKFFIKNYFYINIF